MGNMENMALKRALNKESLLRKLSERVVNTSSPANDKIADTAYDIIRRIGEDFHVDRALLYMCKEDEGGREQIELLAAYTVDGVPEWKEKTLRGCKFISGCLNENNPVIVQDNDGKEGCSFIDKDVRSYVAVTSYMNGRPAVVIVLHQLSVRRNWQNFEIDLLQEAAREVALGLEHSAAIIALYDARRRLEKKASMLAEALEREKKLTALQSEFISMASHEFRTPLAIIDASAQLMQRRISKGEVDPKDSKSIDKIRKAVYRMGQLVNSTLSLTRLETGGMIYNMQCFDISVIINEIVSRFKDMESEREFICEARPEVIFCGDRNFIELCISNLVSNAVKYSSGKIDVVLSESPSELSIIVRDHGKGIAEDEISRIFEKFYRAGNSTGIAGTGIGLYLVKNFAESHGGRITVKSKLGEGSEFTLTLPITHDNGGKNA